MRFSGGVLGSAALVAARKSAGLTQEQLAHETGLSVRALRDLEGGRVRRPRQATLELLIGALALSGPGAQRFERSWTIGETRATFGELVAAGYDLETLVALHSAGEYVDLVVVEKLTIGEHRRLVRSENVVVTQALGAAVDGRLVVWGDDDVYAPSLVRLASVTGAHSAEPIVLRDENLAVFDLTFAPALPQGEIHSFSYDIVFDEQGPAPVDTPRVTRDALHGFRRAVDLYVLQVMFEGCRPPRRAWEAIERDRRGVEVAVPATGLSLIRHHAAAGIHGLVWEW